MSAPITPEPVGFAAVTRAMVAAAAELVTGVQRVVVGPANVRTAKDNAWDAILADRARHEARDELAREVAALLAARPRPELPTRHPASRPFAAAR
ncbi:hypothetical protein ACWKSP_22740 [Micromonosporaceae bacterium Da 78-11]